MTTNRTTVIHVRDMADGDVYIGRPNARKHLFGSPLANPFRIGKDGTREEVIARYREYIQRRPDLLEMLPSLRGKRLACWCLPELCHGHVLVELIEAMYVEPRFAVGDEVPLPEGGRYIVVNRRGAGGNLSPGASHRTDELWVLVRQEVVAVNEGSQYPNGFGNRVWLYWLVGTARRPAPLAPGERRPQTPRLADSDETLSVVVSRWLSEQTLLGHGDANWNEDTGYRPDPEGDRRREEEERERRAREYKANRPPPTLSVIEGDARGRPQPWKVIEGGKRDE